MAKPFNFDSTKGVRRQVMREGRRRFVFLKSNRWSRDHVAVSVSPTPRSKVLTWERGIEELASNRRADVVFGCTVVRAKRGRLHG